MAYQVNYPQGTLELSAEDTSKLNLSSSGALMFDSNEMIIMQINQNQIQINTPNVVGGKSIVSPFAVEVKHGEYWQTTTEGDGENTSISQFGVQCQSYVNAVETRKTTLDKDGLILYNDQTENTNIEEPRVTINRAGILLEPVYGQTSSASINSNGFFLLNPEGDMTMSDKKFQVTNKDLSNNVLSTTFLDTASLSSDVPVFDFSFNALSLGGVEGTPGQVFSVDASGSPYWSTVSASSETPTLSDLLVAGNSVGERPLNMNLQSIQNANDVHLTDSLTAPTTRVNITSYSLAINPSTSVESPIPYTSVQLNSELLQFQNWSSEGAPTTQMRYGVGGIYSAAPFDITLSNTPLKLGGTQGTQDQVITADANGTPYWADVPTSGGTPNLADVLSQETAGDADQKPISNLLSLAVKNSTVANAVVLSQDAGGALNLSSDTSGNVIDTSKDTKEFSGNYLKLSINGQDYYFQAFTVPPS
jgi:hypothetical protein